MQQFQLNILQYDRIDPTEVQTLKDEVSQSKKEAAEAQEKLTAKETALNDSTTRVRYDLIWSKNFMTIKM